MKQKQKQISKDEQQANKAKQFLLSKIQYEGSTHFAKFKRFHLEEQQLLEKNITKIRLVYNITRTG